MSQIQKNIDQIINEEIYKPISSRQKRKNNYFYSDKTKISLFDDSLYIKEKLNAIETKNNLIKNQNNNNIIELTSRYNYQASVDFLNKNNSKNNIYIKKSIHILPHRCNSDRELNKDFLSKLINSQRAHSNSRNNNNKNLLNYKDYKIIKESDENNNNRQNIININLIKEKNNYIENNIINQIYINKNNNKTKTDFCQMDLMNLTDRYSFKRRSNYIYNYLTNNEFNRYKTSCKKKENIKNIKRVNNLPKDKDKYDEIFVIKIQSTIRGYLLNKRLDKTLRNYIKFKEANVIIKRFFKRKIFKIIFQKKHIKKYAHQNIYYLKKRNYPKNILFHDDNENFHLQTKINELIKEKDELQTNYKNLKEFMNRYKQLISEKAQMLQEIDNLRKINNKLLLEQKENKEKNNIYEIQRKNNLTIFNQKNLNLNKEIMNMQKVNSIFISGKKQKENNTYISNNKNELKRYKLKYLIKIKENKTQNILYKYFLKFHYYSLSNSTNNIDNNKPKINVINRRYNNIDNNQNNNLLPYISIKTLSGNSSVFNDAKGKNLTIITSFNTNDEDNKRK